MQNPAITARGRVRDSHAATASLPTSWLHKAGPAAHRIVAPELVVVCLFSLLGLTLTAVALSCVSNDTISIMFSSMN